MIEHVPTRSACSTEIERVLAPDGLLIMSTPDRRAYSDATGRSTTHSTSTSSSLEGIQHDSCGGAFENVAIWGQRTITGSVLAALDGTGPTGPRSDGTGLAGRTFFIERSRATSGGRRPGCRRCTWSPSPRTRTAAGDRVAVDARRLRSWRCERSAQAASASAAARSSSQARVTAEPAARASSTNAACEHQADAAARRPRSSRSSSIASASTSLTARCRAEPPGARGARGAGIAGELARVLRGAREGGQPPWAASDRSGRGSCAARCGSWRRQTRWRRPARADRPAGVPREPRVSLVIPLYSAAELTRGCLEAIRDNTSEVSYEVILVDDAADARDQGAAGERPRRDDRDQRDQPGLSGERQARRGGGATESGWCSATTTSSR